MLNGEGNKCQASLYRLCVACTGGGHWSRGLWLVGVTQVVVVVDDAGIHIGRYSSSIAGVAVVTVVVIVVEVVVAVVVVVVIVVLVVAVAVVGVVGIESE